MCRDIASGADRHLDKLKALPLFPYFFEKRLTIPTSPFSFTSTNGFSVSCFHSFFADPLPSLN